MRSKYSKNIVSQIFIIRPLWDIHTILIFPKNAVWVVERKFRWPQRRGSGINYYIIRGFIDDRWVGGGGAKNIREGFSPTISLQFFPAVSLRRISISHLVRTRTTASLRHLSRSNGGRRTKGARRTVTKIKRVPSCIRRGRHEACLRAWLECFSPDRFECAAHTTL